MAKASSKRSAVRAPRQHSLVWLQGLLSGAMVTLATPSALLLGVLLAPALAAFVFDREPGRPRARSIALFSMAAAVDPLRTLWTTDHSLATAAALLSPTTVGRAWIAAAAGWLLAEATPIAVRVTLEAIAVARVARLRAERAKLVEAWGLEAPPDDHRSAG